MSTGQEKSFIARIRCDGATIGFFGQMLRAELREGRLVGKGQLLTTWHTYSEVDKKMVKFNKNRDPYTRTLSHDMIVYFRCYEDYYNIQIRSQAYCGLYFSKNADGILGAFAGAGGKTTSFNLLNADQSIITLDDIQTKDVTVYLKARNAGLIKRQLLQRPKIYHYGDQTGDLVSFNLEILERNVPYPTSSEPYLYYLEALLSDDEDDD